MVVGAAQDTDSLRCSSAIDCMFCSEDSLVQVSLAFVCRRMLSKLLQCLICQCCFVSYVIVFILVHLVCQVGGPSGSQATMVW